MSHSTTWNKALAGGGAVYMGTAGQVANTLLGVVEDSDPVNVTGTLVKRPLRVHGAELRTRTLIRLTDVSVSFPMPIISNKIVEYCLGKTQTGGDPATGTVIMGNVTSGFTLAPSYSFAYVGQTIGDGYGFRLEIPYCSATNSLEMALGLEEPAKIPFMIDAEDDSGQADYPTFMWNTTTLLDATLSTGDLNRTRGLCYVAGQVSATGDTLTTITANGDPLEDNEELIIKIKRITEPITVTHTASGEDTVDLVSGVDFVMTELEDWLWLQYDLAGTEWNEVGRYDKSIGD